MPRKRGPQQASMVPQRHNPQGFQPHHSQSEYRPEGEEDLINAVVFNRLVDRMSDQVLYFRNREQLKHELKLTGETRKLVFQDYIIIGIFGICLTTVPFAFSFLLQAWQGGSQECSTVAVLPLQLISCCCFVKGAKGALQYLKDQDASRFCGAVLTAMDDVTQEICEAEQAKNHDSRLRTFSTLMDKYKGLLDQCTKVSHAANELATALHNIGVEEASSYQEKHQYEFVYVHAVLAAAEHNRTYAEALQGKREELRGQTAVEQLVQQNTQEVLLLLKAQARGERKEFKEKLRRKETVLQKQLNEVQSALKELEVEEHEEWIMCSQDDLD